MNRYLIHQINCLFLPLCYLEDSSLPSPFTAFVTELLDVTVAKVDDSFSFPISHFVFFFPFLRSFLKAVQMTR